jgi:uncharacterized membrane protein
MTAGERSGADLEAILGRLLTVGTYLAIGVVAVGVALMLASGTSPLGVAASGADVRAIPALLAAGRPEGFLLLGLVAAIATPIGRVVGALVGFVSRGERALAVVATAILGVVAIAVAIGLRAG